MRAVELLEKHYGYKQFRRGQEDIINKIISKEDVLAIMPTGAGKSICYQIPALLFEGITIVISPLISLMKDQVDALKSVGIEAAYINSTLDKYEIEETLFNIKNNKYKIIYVAPERIDSKEFLDTISNLIVSQVAVDEAHCVSQWGHDFRTSYRKIGPFIKKLKSKPVLTAFTATASNEVREDIIRLLSLANPEIFVTGFNRENLEITIVKEGNKDRFLKEYLRKNSNVSGIIYCATRKEVDKLDSDLKELGLSVSKYHAGLSDIERKTNQEDFILDKVQIMIATNAFGMGIDKPNIRFVIHNNMPQSIEGYYQEIGRAGRDNDKSECILLFAPGDIHLQKYLIDNGIVNPDRRVIAYKKLQDMVGLVYSNDCYRKYILKYFGETLKEDCNNCSNCLSDGEQVDKTVDAQKVLSCIYRMGRPFGVSMLVDVLRGSKNKKVVSSGFEKLSTYGIMKDYKKENLVEFINKLISHRLLEQVEGEFPVLKLNNNSIEVIKGLTPVIFKEINIAENKYSFNDLFDILKTLRYEISREEGIPPYLVFGDATIREMSNIYPKSKEEMLNIAGVGEHKFNKYGYIFINTIKEYVLENNIVIPQEKKSDIIKDYINITTNPELLKLLRDIRETFAKSENKHSWRVIPLNTLKEISGRYPTTLEELKDITGFGPKKIQEYGAKIIEIVDNYLCENKINISFQYKEKAKIILDGEERDTSEIAIDMLQAEISIEDISRTLEVSKSTILGYITDYILETGDISFKISLNEYYNKEDEEIIIEICEKIGINKIGLIKKELPKHISYEAIRAVILRKYYNIA